jgi:hypothetical protein
MPNHAINAINTDGLGQCAIGASPNPAGYGERSVSKGSSPPLDICIL